MTNETPGALLASIVQSVAHQVAEQSASIVVADLPAVSSDPLAMEQIFSNLVDNALNTAALRNPADSRLGPVRGIPGVDYERLEVSRSMNTIALARSDHRIAAAFADGAKSQDIVALIEHTKAASLSSRDAADRARERALALSATDVADARRQSEDAAFRRDRLEIRQREDVSGHSAAHDH